MLDNKISNVVSPNHEIMSSPESKYNQNVKQSLSKPFVKLESGQAASVYKSGLHWRKGCECREMCILECDC